MTNAEIAVEESIELILRYGMIDGSHHKQWLLDQVLRLLADTEYDALIADFNAEYNSDPEYDDVWDEGIAP